jgi:hypothetical protein
LFVFSAGLSPRYQPSSSSPEALPIYTEKTFALAVIMTALLALLLGFIGGFVTSKRCPHLPATFRSATSHDATSGHHHKDLFTMEIVDKTLSLKK